MGVVAKTLDPSVPAAGWQASRSKRRGAYLGRKATKRKGKDMTTQDKKDVRDYTAEELHAEAVRLAHAYFEHRGYEDVTDGGQFDVIAREGETTVLVRVSEGVDLGDVSDLPELPCDRDTLAECRSQMFLWLSGHGEVASARVDLVAVKFVGQKSARLRHLVGACCWDE